MQRREGHPKEAAKRIEWETIFGNPQDHFVLNKDEYSSQASVRSSGIGYRNRNNLKGALHVIEEGEGDERLLKVWFTPGEEDDEESETTSSGSQVETAGK